MTDPWNLVARPILWFVLFVLTVKEAVRLNWAKLRTKPSPGIETVRTD